jgi:hypothetical protein
VPSGWKWGEAAEKKEKTSLVFREIEKGDRRFMEGEGKIVMVTLMRERGTPF